MTSDIAAAWTFLFVPGDRPDRFGKAAASGADIVIVDLEDAISSDRKNEAREHVRRWPDRHHQAIVRVNAADSPWHADDVDMVTRFPGAVTAVMVSKAEDPDGSSPCHGAFPAGHTHHPAHRDSGGNPARGSRAPWRP
jgi:citrate lyase subunit beta / citryl-CoA lyase